MTMACNDDDECHSAHSTVDHDIDIGQRPMRNYDGTVIRDSTSKVVFKSQFLSTHPIKADCKERVGYAGRKLSYVTGDGVIRTMNAVFGHGGWSSQITMERNIHSEKDERGRWCVGYLASVRVSLLHDGAPSSHEDCGSGEGIDPSKIKAHEKAMKTAVTDAMKRAARHFGERLGNALYVKGQGIRTAPRTNKDALLQLERQNKVLFGDQTVLRDNLSNAKVALGSPEDKKISTVSTGTKITALAGANSGLNALQKENLPQNQMGVGPSTTTTVARSFNTRPSSNCAVASTAQQQHSAAVSAIGSSVFPSPSASSSSHHPLSNGGPVQPHQHGALNNIRAGARTGNYLLASSSDGDNNIIYPQQPPNHNLPNSMAPPPGGGHHYNARGNNISHVSGKPSGNHHHRDNHAGHQNTVATGCNTSTNNINSDNNAKRQKVNPYSSNNGSKKRMSV